MSRNRFLQLLQAWHCSNNDELPPRQEDPYFKVRKPMKTLNSNLLKLTELTKEVSFDESTWNAWVSLLETNLY
jgi:hypothetical protein